MSSIREMISTEIKNAMKAKDQERLGTLRMIKAEVLKKETAAGAGELAENGFIALIQTMKKQRLDAVQQFEKGGRPELAEKEKGEIAVLEGFLPQQLDDAALTLLVAEIGAALGASEMKAMGPLIQAVREKTAGAAEGKRISEAVKSYLAGKGS